MEKEITIDLGRCFKAVLKKWWMVIIFAFAGFGVMFAVMPSPTTSYYAISSVYGAAYSYTESLQTVNLLSKYSDVAGSLKVADRAATIIGNSMLSGTDIQSMTAVSSDEDSAILYFRAVCNDPDMAVTIANALAESFVIEMQSKLGNDNISVLDEANGVTATSGHSKLFYGAIGFLVCFLVTIIVIMLREIFSDRLYYVSDASMDGEIEILGVIPETRK